jgi:hypothetical protein
LILGTNSTKQLQGTYWASNLNYQIFYQVPTNNGETYHVESLAIPGSYTGDFWTTNWAKVSQLTTTSNSLAAQIAAGGGGSGTTTNAPGTNTGYYVPLTNGAALNLSMSNPTVDSNAYGNVALTNWVAVLVAAAQSAANARMDNATNDLATALLADIAQIPSGVVTNGESGVTLSGTFTGSFSGTNLPNAQETSICITNYYDGQYAWVRSNMCDHSYVRIETNGNYYAWTSSGWRSSSNGVLNVSGAVQVNGAPITGGGGGIPLLGGSGTNTTLVNPTITSTNLITGRNLWGTNTFNVRAFGAVGDGVADDTLAISNAWKMWGQNGGVLYFPTGVYLDKGAHADTNFEFGLEGIDRQSDNSKNRSPYSILGDGVIASKWISTNLPDNGLFLKLEITTGMRGMSIISHNYTAANVSGISTGLNVDEYFENLEINNWTGIALATMGSGTYLSSILMASNNVGLQIAGFGDATTALNIRTYVNHCGVVIGGTNANFGGPGMYTNGFAYVRGGVTMTMSSSDNDFGLLIGAGFGHFVQALFERSKCTDIGIGTPPGFEYLGLYDAGQTCNMRIGGGYTLNPSQPCMVLYKSCWGITLDNWNANGPLIASSNLLADASQILLKNVVSADPRLMRYSTGVQVTNTDYQMADVMIGGGMNTVAYDNSTNIVFQNRNSKFTTTAWEVNIPNSKGAGDPRWRSASDTNATAFLAMSGITDPLISSAIHKLAKDLKSSGLWNRLYALYPFVGGTSNSTRFNLMTNAYHITWGSGGTVYPTYGPLGVTGSAGPDTSTGSYGDTGFVPIDPNNNIYVTNVSLFTYCQSVQPLGQGGSYGSPIGLVQDGNTYGLTLDVSPASGTVTLSAAYFGGNTVLNFPCSTTNDIRGPMMLTRDYDTVYCYSGWTDPNQMALGYCPAGNPSTAFPALGSGSIYVLAKHQGVPYHSINGTLSMAGIGQHFSVSQWNTFRSIVDTFNALMGRCVVSGDLTNTVANVNPATTATTAGTATNGPDGSKLLTTNQFAAILPTLGSGTGQTNWPVAAITNLQSAQLPASAITNAPWITNGAVARLGAGSSAVNLTIGTSGATPSGLIFSSPFLSALGGYVMTLNHTNGAVEMSTETLDVHGNFSGQAATVAGITSAQVTNALPPVLTNSTTGNAATATSVSTNALTGTNALNYAQLVGTPPSGNNISNTANLNTVLAKDGGAVTLNVQGNQALSAPNSTLSLGGTTGTIGWDSIFGFRFMEGNTNIQASIHGGTVTATNFVGNLTGNATSATTAVNVAGGTVSGNGAGLTNVWQKQLLIGAFIPSLVPPAGYLYAPLNGTVVTGIANTNRAISLGPSSGYLSNFTVTAIIPFGSGTNSVISILTNTVGTMPVMSSLSTTLSSTVTNATVTGVAVPFNAASWVVVQLNNNSTLPVGTLSWSTEWWHQ